LLYTWELAMKNNENSSHIRDLTRAEEQVMQVLWDLGRGMVRDMIGKFPAPRPAYTTVSTIIRILEQKGFVSHKAYGRSYEYFPLVSKKEYTRSYFRNMVANYFSNSYQSLTSFFTSEEKLSLEELEEIQKLIHKQIEQQKNNLRKP
jgi:BlaI family penicillinase repressor